MPGTIETGVVLGLLVTITSAVLKYGHGNLKSDIDGKAGDAVEDEVEDLRNAHQETRRMAEAAYTSAYGDEDRPEDTGFMIESKERWDNIEDQVDDLSKAVDRLEQSQERHQQKTEAVLEAVADELDIDLIFRGGSDD